MALDDKTLKLLELEYVDDLGNLLTDPVFTANFLKAIYESDEEMYQDCELYEAFSEKYKTMKTGFKQAKENLAIAEKRSEEHTLFFQMLKNYFDQIETALEGIGKFFEDDENQDSSNFRKNFQPYLAYFDVIENANRGIIYLSKIYSGLVDCNVLCNKYRIDRQEEE